MFIGFLDKKNKRLFLDLAIKAADCSDGISSEELEVLRSLSKETEEQLDFEQKKELSDIIAELETNTSTMEKRIIYFEILGIMYADGVFDDKERSFVDMLKKRFMITDEISNKLLSDIKEYSDLFTRMCDEVLGGE